MVKVEFCNVSKSFQEAEVLREVNLTVEPGEFLVLVGPSGCGKSTLLRILAGLEEPTAGQILIGGKDVTLLEPKDRDVAMVFQNYALYPHMTVYENMAFGLRVRKLPAAEIKKRVEEAGEILRLTKYLNRRPKELSGGQKQRVALGRALVRKAPVFLFDEPLSNLDAALRSQMRIEIKRLHRMFGNTVIYVTHDQVEATTLGDRIAVLNGGLVQQIDTPRKIFHEPKNRFVASFIGIPEMNFLEGSVERSSSGVAFHFEGGAIPLASERFASSGPITLGVRPEDLRIGAGTASSFPARVELQEFLGASQQTFISVGKTQLRVLTAESCRWQPGENVSVSIDPKNVHFFDRISGARL